ncbi:EamA family transporter, partial [Turicibacter sanguinis]
MWILYAIGSAFFAGVTSILAKIGIQQTDSNVATAIRTVVVLVFSWFMVFIVGSFQTISEISLKTLLFLILSGLATGGSWLCYFKALQLGDVNKVTPIDKSSTVLTMILAFIFLGERLSITKLLGMIGIGVGTYLMIMKKEDIQKEVSNRRWMFYAILSAILASLTAILGKVGIIGVESNLGTAIRTIVVLIMAWIIVFVTHKQHEVKHIDSKSWFFIVLSG